MADQSLLRVDEFLLKLVVRVMYLSPAMTSAQIAKLASDRSAHQVSRRKVEAMLTSLAGGLVSVADVPPSQVVRGRRRGFLRRAAHWTLVEVPESGLGPAASGSRVPARPHPSASSGAAAVPMTFRTDDPPTNAIGRIA